MATVDAETDFLDLAYEAAIEPQLWTNVLERFADLVGGSEANLITQDEASCQGHALHVGNDPAAMPLYLNHFIKCSPFLKTTDLPLGLRVITDEDKMSGQELAHTEFYNDFMRRFDYGSFLIARLALQKTSTTTVNVVRSARQEKFGRPELETARRLHPHLIRAYKLAMRLTGMRQLRDSREMVVDSSSLGVFVLDDKGAVRHVNRAGESLVARSRELTIQRGILHGPNPIHTRRLHALIAAAVGRGPTSRSGGAMALPRAGRRPLSISVAPIRSTEISFFDLGPSVLVCVSDPDTDVPVPEQRLRDLFGLSPAEARVASQILLGHDPHETAKRLGVSFYTVRGRLVRIYGKTGVNRQAELVRLMIRAVGSPAR